MVRIELPDGTLAEISNRVWSCEDTAVATAMQVVTEFLDCDSPAYPDVDDYCARVIAETFGGSVITPLPVAPETAGPPVIY